jgi:hypothetical protein
MRGPLTAREKAGLARVIRRRVEADERYYEFLRGGRSMPLAEWRKRRAIAMRARKAEDTFTEKLFMRPDRAS